MNFSSVRMDFWFWAQLIYLLALNDKYTVLKYKYMKNYIKHVGLIVNVFELMFAFSVETCEYMLCCA